MNKETAEEIFGPMTDDEKNDYLQFEENIKFMIRTSDLMTTLHRVKYLNYLKAGFSESQAMDLCR